MTAIEPLAERYDAGTNEEYHAGEGVSRSMLEDYRKDPYLYFKKHHSGERVKSSTTPSMILGTAVHELALLGDYESVRPVPAEIANLTGKGSRTALNEWKDENPAEHYISANDDLAIRRIITEINHHEAARKLIFGLGESEVPIRGVDRSTGILLRCKLDRMTLTNDTVVISDIKTTTDASPKAFANTIARYGYHRQAAFYSQLSERLTGKPAEFYFVAVETGVVPRVEVYQIEEDALLAGERELFDADTGLLPRLAESLATNNWRPSHYGKVLSIGLPRWTQYDEEWQV